MVESSEVFNIFANPERGHHQNFITTANLRKIEELIAKFISRQAQSGRAYRAPERYIQRNVSELHLDGIGANSILCSTSSFLISCIVQGAFPIGGTVAISYSGEREQIHTRQSYLSEKNVGVEVIKDARVSE